VKRNEADNLRYRHLDGGDHPDGMQSCLLHI
jgi:hypothetical protein